MSKPCKRCSKRHLCSKKKSKPRSTKNEETAKIREAVMARAQGRCEGNGDGKWAHHCMGALELDHWLGGSGRRIPEQSVETCWALCAKHHRYKTEALPSAAEWNARFMRHCLRYGYPVLSRVTHEPVRRAAP